MLPIYEDRPHMHKCGWHRDIQIVCQYGHAYTSILRYTYNHIHVHVHVYKWDSGTLCICMLRTCTHLDCQTWVFFTYLNLSSGFAYLCLRSVSLSSRLRCLLVFLESSWQVFSVNFLKFKKWKQRGGNDTSADLQRRGLAINRMMHMIHRQYRFLK